MYNSAINMQRCLQAAAISLATIFGSAGCGGGEEPSSTAEQGSSRTAVTAEALQYPATAGIDLPSSGSDSTQRSFAMSRISSAGATGDRNASTNAAAAVAPVDQRDAFRFLSQATFGPSPAAMADLSAKTYDEWFDRQIAMPWRALQPRVKASYLEQVAIDPQSKGDRSDVISAFWREALTGQAQLRWRVAYAWSQIFVYSVNGSIGLNDPMGSANYFDMLARNGLGTYRELLELVARHPAMGRYLSHLGNQSADDLTGRVPDENFAREVMQLFSIGLHKLNLNGTPKLDAKQHRIPTYDAEDVVGLARVFTGLSWNCNEGRTERCFTNWFANMGDPYVGTRPMVSYAAYHSKEEKRFLGEVIPAQTVANPEASLRIALDTIANHPNVGPFIGRQLIQRLVTSNPSPGYVAAVAAVFNDNGRGRRGDLSAVVRAILMHEEARVRGEHEGKVREPVLLLTALARALPVHSVTGDYIFRSNESYDYALGQIPLFSPSVFNYYRPGFVPRGGGLGMADMAGPELQIVDENSVAAYVRFMRRAIQGGFGAAVNSSARPDMELDLGGLTPLADKPVQLMDRVFGLLLGDAVYPELRAEIEQAVRAIKVPDLNPKRTNQGYIAHCKRLRVQAALLLTVASPEFIVQH